MPPVTGPDVPAPIAKLVDDFYRESDLPSNDGYMACFAPDAHFNIFGLRKGHDEILENRIWGATTRTNQVHRYSHIWMTEPNVAYVLGDIDFDRTADGYKIRNNQYIARFTTNGDEKNPKIQDYYVWVVSEMVFVWLIVAIPAHAGGNRSLQGR